MKSYRSNSRIWRSIAALTALLTVWLTTPTVWAEVCLDADTAQTVRDKARSYEEVCQRLPEQAQPTWMLALCDDPGQSGQWWVKAQQYKECADRLRTLQRKANADKGALSEARRAKTGWVISTVLLGIALGGVSAGWALK